MAQSLITGRHAVLETLSAKPGLALELWLEDSLRHGEIPDLARSQGIPVHFRPRREIDRIAGGRGPGRPNHQGVVLRLRAEPGGSDFGPASLEALAASLPKKAGAENILVALDEIQDPQNFGSIARSAANFGAAGLIVCSRRACPVTPAVVRSSAGAVQKTRIFEVPNMARALEKLKKLGLWVYGADLGGEDLRRASLQGPAVLVIGSEGRGLRPLVRSSCDALLKIPQSPGGVQSLNAAAAAAVILYEFARRGD